MTRRKLDNITFVIDQFFEPFSVNGYRFYSKHSRSNIRIEYKSSNAVKSHRKHNQNAYVEFQGRQQDSILFRGGYEGPEPPGKRRKILDDILVVGSILTGKNWLLYSRRNYPQNPVISSIHLECISKDSDSVNAQLNQAMTEINDSNWQKKYENGFHLVMLLNHANILVRESRFLSNIVIWEWLYPHLKNPNQATIQDESNNLHRIIKFVLEYYWPDQLNKDIFQESRVNGKSGNIFYVLRNQLAHSGKLPINRGYEEDWMKQLQGESTDRNDIKDYLKFFDRLTQIVVLKTLGIEGTNSLTAFNFPDQLDSFLKTGKI